MRTIYSKSEITPELEERLLGEAKIVFDTSSLFRLYYLVPKHMKTLIDIFKILSDRVWVPAHVFEEYSRNRACCCQKPRSEKYRESAFSKNGIVDELRSFVEEREENPFMHPVVTEETLKKLKDCLSLIETPLADAKTALNFDFQEQKKVFEAFVDEKNDPVKQWIDSIDKGAPFTYKEILEIIKEGDLRYRHQLPPGYMDAVDVIEEGDAVEKRSKEKKGNKKDGIDKFGDLIIWKEIIRHSIDADKDILFISNDVVKGDTVILQGVEKGNPRRELLTEFEECTNHNVWFYTLEKFIDKLISHYKGRDLFETVADLDSVLYVLKKFEIERKMAAIRTGQKMMIKCDNCKRVFPVWEGELDMEWENTGTEERGMGPEEVWSSKNEICCPHCHNDISIEFCVSEYPMGFVNYENVEMDGGEILSNPNVAEMFKSTIDDEFYDECERCGKRCIANRMGLCEDCENDYQNFMRED